MPVSRDWLLMVRDAGAPAARLESEYYRREDALAAAQRLAPSPRYDAVYVHRPHTGEVQAVKQPPTPNAPPPAVAPAPPPAVTPRPLRDTSMIATLARVAATLSQPFTVAQLVIAAWAEDKSRWGLRGYEDEHPDSGRVFSCLCGVRGAVARGLLRKLPGGLYEVAT